MPSSFNQLLLKVAPSLIHKMRVLTCGSRLFAGLSKRPWTAFWNGWQVVGKRLLVQPAAPGSPDVAQSVGTRKEKSPMLGSLKTPAVTMAPPLSTLLILMM